MLRRLTLQVRSSPTLLCVVGCLFLPAVAWGSLRVGNAELQVFYAQQHAFQYDDGEYGMDWVQFRNELTVKYTYNKLIDRHLFFEQIHVPFIEKATVFAHYLGRFDPVGTEIYRP